MEWSFTGMEKIMIGSLDSTESCMKVAFNRENTLYRDIAWKYTIEFVTELDT